MFGRIRTLYRRLFRIKLVELDGVRLSTKRGTVSKQIRRAIYNGNYEDAERVLVREALSPNDKVLEIGAGVGLISLLCARIVGEKNVLSFEPNPVAVDLIRTNFALNGMAPQLRNEAVTEEGGIVEFNISENIYSSSLYNRNVQHTNKSVVKSERFSRLLEEYAPSVLVMDIEGTEADLLSKGTLPGVEKIIVELHPHIVGETRIEDLSKHLRAIGFNQVSSIDKTVYLRR